MVNRADTLGAERPTRSPGTSPKVFSELVLLLDSSAVPVKGVVREICRVEVSHIPRHPFPYFVSLFIEVSEAAVECPGTPM
jgi:hypothetical protein